MADSKGAVTEYEQTVYSTEELTEFIVYVKNQGGEVTGTAGGTTGIIVTYVLTSE